MGRPHWAAARANEKAHAQRLAGSQRRELDKRSALRLPSSCLSRSPTRRRTACHAHTERTPTRGGFAPIPAKAPYLKSRQIKRREAVEETQTLNGHPDRVLCAALLGAGGAGVRGGAVEEGAVEHVQNPSEVRGLEGCCQACGILAIPVKYAV